jgi:uncharacterized protein YecE (DUF72 family)
MKKWWIGCSGFYYKNWKGAFYPPELPQKRWFEFYCEHFNSLELNVTFYRYPTIETLRDLYLNSPSNFRFSAKVPRFITHFWKFKDCQRQMNDFYRLVENGLREKAGGILFQLHPRYTFSPEKLNAIVDIVDPNFSNAIEFRHESWWNDEVIAALLENRMAFCGISHPQLPERVMPSKEDAYFRFHGVPDLYHSSYHHRTLQKKHNEFNSLSVSNIYVYFNNDAYVAAPKNAKTLMRYTRQPSLLAKV